jgi:hypothetical protein
MAISTLPRMAMPSAPPSSAPVSEIPDAAPACSGRAEPTISSVVNPNTGASPSEISSDAATSGDQAVAGADLGKHGEADGRQGEPPGDHERRAELADDPRAELGPDDEAEGGRQRPQTRLEWGQPHHQLEVLGDEQE